VSQLSVLGAGKAYTVFKLAKRALSLPGDFIECGVFQGGTSLMLGLILEEARSEKQVFMCDTFAGLPRPDRTVDKAYEEGTMACAAETVEQSVSRMGLGGRCVLLRGLFRDTFRTFSERQTFAFAHLDCDLYHGTKDSLEFLYPRLAEQAPIALDDYYDESHGVMRAVNECAERHGLVIHLGAWGQAFMVKGEHATVAVTYNIGPHRVHLTTEAVQKEPVFLRYLEAITRAQEGKTRRLRHFLEFCRNAWEEGSNTL
jgi:O-methyltransferase